MWDVRLKYVKRQEDKNMDENVASLQISSPELTIDPQDPWSDDRLERKFFADHLTQIISGQVNPCVITINGEWGSGKTFLLKRWQCELLQKLNSTPFALCLEEPCDGDSPLELP